MTHDQIEGLGRIEYVGLPGMSKECQAAILRILQYGDKITIARVLTANGNHCFLLTINIGELVAVKSGFASGYVGEGPHTFSYILQLLDAHGAEIEEYEVTPEYVGRLDASALTQADLDDVVHAGPVSPARWHDYISERDWYSKSDGTLWREFPPVIPYAIIDARIADLARQFWDSPDARLLDGYRRLEDLFRSRSGLQEYGQRLFNHALLPPTRCLEWDVIEDGERQGRVGLFTNAFMAHRNPRAHREQEADSCAQLSEFLLLNHLFLLDGQLRPIKTEELMPSDEGKSGRPDGQVTP